MSKLKCRYINYHPFLYIAPVKEEIVFDDPKMWLYHDVITDKQIETMKRLAFPKVY
jgi:prolyl 4-hydroxylase